MVVLCADFGFLELRMHGMDMDYACRLRRGKMRCFSRINIEDHMTFRLKYCTQIIMEMK